MPQFRCSNLLWLEDKQTKNWTVCSVSKVEEFGCWQMWRFEAILSFVLTAGPGGPGGPSLPFNPTGPCRQEDGRERGERSPKWKISRWPIRLLLGEVNCVPVLFKKPFKREICRHPQEIFKWCFWLSDLSLWYNQQSYALAQIMEARDG